MCPLLWTYILPEFSFLIFKKFVIFFFSRFGPAFAAPFCRPAMQKPIQSTLLSLLIKMMVHQFHHTLAVFPARTANSSVDFICRPAMQKPIQSTHTISFVVPPWETMSACLMEWNILRSGQFYRRIWLRLGSIDSRVKMSLLQCSRQCYREELMNSSVIGKVIMKSKSIHAENMPCHRDQDPLLLRYSHHPQSFRQYSYSVLACRNPVHRLIVSFLLLSRRFTQTFGFPFSRHFSRNGRHNGQSYVFLLLR